MRSVEEVVRSEAASRVSLPRPWAWAGAALVVAVAGGVVVYLRRRSFADAPAEPVRGDVLGAALTGTEAVVVLAAVLVVTVWCVRRFLFARAVRRPGGIEVLPFVNGTGEDLSFEATTATFRKTLAELSLASPNPLPGTAPVQGFLRSVVDGARDTSGAVAMVTGLLSTLTVDCGYRVTVTARTAPSGPRCGLDVCVVALPAGPAETRTVWGDSWSSVARRAADVVGAYVLARTALCTKGPWPHWRGRRIDPRLFGFYQRAQACLREQRYEEALGFCFEALELDPLNAPIRILACQVEEKLGLYLSAVTGYADVIATESWGARRRVRVRIERDFASLGGASSRRGLPWSPGSRRRNRESLLISRYRFVCALANADNVMDRGLEGRSGGDNAIRRNELSRLRQRMSRWSETYGGHVRGAPRTEPPDQHRALRLIAWREADELYRDYAWRRGLRRPRMPISQGALRLLRIWTLAHLDEYDVSDVPELVACRQRLGWPSSGSPRAIAEIVDRELKRTSERRRSFQEYYNAAATLGVALQVRPRCADAEKAARSADDAALAAVGYLEQAVESAPRAMVWQYSRWFAAEDQSLKVLRGSWHYVDFLERHFPGMTRREERPENVLEYLFSSHVLRLARSYAHLQARRAGARPELDGHAARAAELRAVRAMRDYCRDHRDWRTRLALIRSCGNETDDPAPLTLDRSFPRFQDEPGLASRQPADGARVPVDHYFTCLVRRRLDGGVWRAVGTDLAQVAEKLEQPAVGVVVDTTSMWERLSALVDASLEDREPSARTTMSPCVEERLADFRAAARSAVASPPQARPTMLAHLPVRLRRGEGTNGRSRTP